MPSLALQNGEGLKRIGWNTWLSKMLEDSDGGLKGDKEIDRLRDKQGPNSLLCGVPACTSEE